MAGLSYADRVVELSHQAASGQGSWKHLRVAMDGFKWLACKCYPKMFGDRQPAQQQPQQHTHIAQAVIVCAPEQRAAMLQARAAFLGQQEQPEQPQPLSLVDVGTTSDNKTNAKSTFPDSQ